MFNLIKTEYYDDFQCSMSDCPANCCDEAWLVTIDEQTYQKYLGSDIPDLDNKISPASPHVILHDRRTGRCPFITAEGLCTLHATYGEDFLSNTCKSYPRFVTDYGPVVTQTLGLSCPEVAHAVLNMDHLITLREEVMYEHKHEIGQPYLPTNAEARMKTCIAVFYDASGSVEQCLKECLTSVDADHRSLMLGNMDPAPACLDETYPLLEKNIAISFLFEHLMLESLNPEPDYALVVLKCADLLNAFRNALLSAKEDLSVPDDIFISGILYRLMRQMDH